MDSISIEVCSICRKAMTDPKILPCTHSFCLKCLESTSSSKRSKCPTCQIAFPMPSGGLKNLKNNEFLEQLKNVKQRCTGRCSCRENREIRVSVECSHNCSPTCMVPCGRSPTTSGQRLKPTASFDENSKASQFPICKDHVDDMKVFCEDCNVLLCVRCLMFNHKSHNMKHISDHFDTVKRNFEQIMKMKENALKDVNLSCRSAHMTLCHNNIESSNLKKAIEERGEDVKKAVDSIIAGLISNVDEESERYQNEANDIIMKLENMEADLKAQLDTMKRQLNDLSYENFIEASPGPPDERDSVPKYCEMFLMTFQHDEQTNNLDKIVGHLCNAKPESSIIHQKALSNLSEIDPVDFGEWEKPESSAESTTKPSNFLRRLFKSEKS